MSQFLVLLNTVHKKVHKNHLQHSLNVAKKMYSEPGIYAGGLDLFNRVKFSAEEIQNAMSKYWYVYYSYQNPATGKLERMPNIKLDLNRYKEFSERVLHAKTLRKALLTVLQSGYNPFVDADFEAANVDQILEPTVSPPVITPVALTPAATIAKPKRKVAPKREPKTTKPAEPTVQDAIEFALKMKKNVMSPTSYQNFQSRIKRFLKAVDATQGISKVTRQIVMDYLNNVQIETSPRNRDNTRADLSVIFQVLEDNEIIPTNFIKGIPKMKSKPERNKTYADQTLEEIWAYVEKTDPDLSLFIKFFSYNFLRPVEVCRLKIGDIDIENRVLRVRAKNQLHKTKIIPEVLLSELPDLSKFDREAFLFTPNGIGLHTDTEENNRRDYFSKRFKLVKDHFNLGKDYGLYSFRHTYITKLYRGIRAEKSPHEAKSMLMQITGHSTMTALEAYLRDIDAELPNDYSHFLTKEHKA